MPLQPRPDQRAAAGGPRDEGDVMTAAIPIAPAVLALGLGLGFSLGPAGPAAATDPAPGTRLRVDAARLPAPGNAPSPANSPQTVDRPKGAGLRVPDGFRATLFAE